MQNKLPDDDLLIKYLLRELDAEEEAFVVGWLGSDERNRRYYEKLERLWKLTALKNTTGDIDIDQEWMHFMRRISKKGLNVSHIQGQESPGNLNNATSRQGVYRILRSVAVAAVVLLIIGMGWLYYSQKAPEVQIATSERKTSKDSVTYLARHEVNYTGKPRTLLLHDGSEIVLEDKSEVNFLQPFTGNRRDITLEGKATFKIAKDKTRPFTVFSDAISTTVLGTVFDVTARGSSNKITIRLYEGKVVVESVQGSKRKLKNSFYLSPGYELVYDKRKVSASVKRFIETNTPARTKIQDNTINQDNPNIPKNNKNPWFMFNNQPLDEVLELLKEMYNAEIIYSKADVQKIYIIGQFSKDDSLETILNQVAKSNDLKVTRENNKYIISK